MKINTLQRLIITECRNNEEKLKGVDEVIKILAEELYCNKTIPMVQKEVDKIEGKYDKEAKEGDK